MNSYYNNNNKRSLCALITIYKKYTNNFDKRGTEVNNTICRKTSWSPKTTAWSKKYRRTIKSHV